MKIVFFIGRRQIDNFSFNALLNRERYRFVAIIANDDYLTLTEAAKVNFDLVRGVTGYGDKLLSELDFQQVCKIIQNEIANYHSVASDVAIVCQDEANILLAGKIRDLFHIKTGAKASELDVFRDKVLMKNKLKRNNIRVPHYIALEKNQNFNEIVTATGLPFIVKPVSSAGSFGIYIVTNLADYEKFIAEHKSKIAEYEAEEFIDGRLFHCDMAVKSKKLLFQECGMYTCPNLNFKKGAALGSIAILHEDPLFKPIAEFSEKALHALEPADGAYHMELFIDTKTHEIIFLEVGARAPGFTVSNIYEKTFGYNPLDADLYIQAGIEFKHENKKLTPSFWVIFPIKKGVVSAINEPILTSNFETKWLVKVGQETGECKSLVDFGGILFASNENYAILKKDFEIITDHQAILY